MNTTHEITLARSSAIATKIMKCCNLRVVIPVWSSGGHMSIGSIEERHFRQEWVSRGTIDFVEGKWVVSETFSGVADCVRDVLSALGEPV